MSLFDVERWSLKIHGRCDRHDWCMEVARALVNDEPLPTRRYSRMKGIDEARIETIERLLARPAAPRSLPS